MAANDNSLLDLAAAVADGSGVDWARVHDGEWGPEPKRLADQLRLIATIAEVHRSGEDDAVARTGELPPPGPTPDSAPRAAASAPPLGRWGELILLEEVG